MTLRTTSDSNSFNQKSPVFHDADGFTLRVGDIFTTRKPKHYPSIYINDVGLGDDNPAVNYLYQDPQLDGENYLDELTADEIVYLQDNQEFHIDGDMLLPIQHYPELAVNTDFLHARDILGRSVSLDYDLWINDPADFETFKAARPTGEIDDTSGEPLTELVDVLIQKDVGRTGKMIRISKFSTKWNPNEDEWASWSSAPPYDQDNWYDYYYDWFDQSIYSTASRPEPVSPTQTLASLEGVESEEARLYALKYIEYPENAHNVDYEVTRHYIGLRNYYSRPETVKDPKNRRPKVVYLPSLDQVLDNLSDERIKNLGYAPFDFDRTQKTETTLSWETTISSTGMRPICLRLTSSAMFVFTGATSQAPHEGYVTELPEIDELRDLQRFIMPYGSINLRYTIKTTWTEDDPEPVHQGYIEVLNVTGSDAALTQDVLTYDEDDPYNRFTNSLYHMMEKVVPFRAPRPTD